MNRGSSKCGCRAYMRITLKKGFDIFPEEWHVTIFVKEHNKDMLSSEELRFLPANRNITSEDEKKMLYKEAGLSIRQIIRAMELEKNLKHGELPFFDRDIRNLYGKLKSMIGPDDAKNLMQYLKTSKEENKLFQYVFTLDEKMRLENLFWCHAQSFEWYQKYGDAVVFDTTYKVNSYDMPCAIFVGLDNYGKTILLGFALLRNETTPTFKCQGHLHNKVVATLRPVSLIIKSPLEKQAFEILTPFAFKNTNFVIKYFEDGTFRQHKVFWDENISTCTCKNFEFWGMICWNILRVFVHKYCFTIPPYYLPPRWRSKTKGRPKTKRCRGGKEIRMKKTKCCSICKQPGHIKPTCPNKENFFSSNIMDESISFTSQKKQKQTAEDLGLNPIFTLKI
ncbi:hypothetical protein RND81_12G036200 [Saponaria officinalis]|uniref:Protein FAR1-RELATED SEQUENCE n=1 Tax=Saponaria officinalis TaxID=3572 RepID=A0AAW1H2U6_SAPOF